MTVSAIEDAVVVAQDPDNYAVFVSLLGKFGAQGTFLSVQVMTHGPRDAVRGQYPELPTVGTHGRVSFTRGDIRNGVWLGSTRTQLQDASAHAPGLGGLSYAAHWGGGQSARGPDGTTTEIWPDGSQLQIGPTVAPATRHSVVNQQRMRTAFTPSQRVAAKPAAFPITFTHPSGASLSLTAAGAWTITAAPGQSTTLAVSGVTSVVIDAAGSISVTSPGALSLTATTAVNLRAPSITSGNGGTTQLVKLANGSNSTIFQAQ